MLVNALRFTLSSKMFIWKNTAMGGAAIKMQEGEITIEKAPLAKKIQMVKKGQINQTKRILDTKR
jgi:hypothetical protein